MAAAGITDPVQVLRHAVRTWLDICVEPEIHRIALTDGPSVLGWARWREVCQRHVFGHGSPQATVVADPSNTSEGITILVERWTAAEKTLRITSGGPARVALRLLNYPAWRVEVNGSQVAPENAAIPFNCFCSGLTTISSVS